MASAHELIASRYNSAFFSSSATNDYQIFYVTDAFVQGLSPILSGGSEDDYTTLAVSIQAELNQHEALQNEDCIRAYAVDFVTDRRTLVLVAVNREEHESSFIDYAVDAFEPLTSGYGPNF